MNIIQKLWRKFTRKRRRGNRRVVSISLRPEVHDLGRKLARHHNIHFSSLLDILIEQEAQRVFAEPQINPAA